MANLPDGYDHEQDYGSFGKPDPVPAGDYTAMIVESEKKDNRAGTGSFIALVMEILDVVQFADAKQKGDFKGRKLFENMNLWHPNNVTVRIAMAEMKALCNACGGLRPKDTEELHHIPFIVSVGLRTRQDTGELQNSIKAFKPVGSASTPPAVAAGGGETKPPWKK